VTRDSVVTRLAQAADSAVAQMAADLGVDEAEIYWDVAQLVLREAAGAGEATTEEVQAACRVLGVSI
jgi:hypothetical protein